MSRLARVAAIATLAVLPSVCAGCAGAASVGDGAPSYAVRGMYSGTLSVGGQRFTGALSLRTAADGGVSGSLRVLAPLRIDGSVRGRIIDDLLRVTIAYRGADGCESRIEGILTVQGDGGAVEGPVTVHDCGGDIAGRMSFER